MAFYDLDSDLIVEAGRIEIMIGSSSEDIRLGGLFEITGVKKRAVEERGCLFCQY